MKPTAILPLAIVLVTASAAAQAISGRLIVLSAPSSPNEVNCPVGMEANHGSSLLQRKTINGHELDPGIQGNEPGQRILLKMMNQRSQDIVSLEITIHGLSNKGRTIQLSGEPKADLVKRVHLVKAVKPSDSATSHLTLPHFTTVTSIDLDAVTYADGSVWRPESAQVCRVTPNPLMLVAGER
jgi:hypothetical protein